GRGKIHRVDERVRDAPPGFPWASHRQEGHRRHPRRSMSVTIKAICRDLGVSRKVVRKVIRSGSTEFRYHPEEQPLPKIYGRWKKHDMKISSSALPDGIPHIRLLYLG